MSLYSEKCSTPLTSGIRQGIISALSFGLSNLMLFSVYGITFCAGADGRSYVNNWYEVNDTILYELKPLQGFNCLCHWIFCGSCWMARHWNDNGSLWLYCSLQWFLAHCFDIFAEDSCSGLVTPTTIP